MKHFVICGPELTDRQFVIGRELIWKLYENEVTSASDPLNLTYPEAEYGAGQVRNMIDSAMLNGTQVFITTRYEPALSYMLQLETNRKYNLKHKDIITLLFRNKECTEPTIHILSSDGFFESWPMGILW
jgi:hypothetical protein